MPLQMPVSGVGGMGAMVRRAAWGEVDGEPQGWRGGHTGLARMLGLQVRVAPRTRGSCPCRCWEELGRAPCGQG